MIQNQAVISGTRSAPGAVSHSRHPEPGPPTAGPRRPCGPAAPAATGGSVILLGRLAGGQGGPAGPEERWLTSAPWRTASAARDLLTTEIVVADSWPGDRPA